MAKNIFPPPLPCIKLIRRWEEEDAYNCLIVSYSCFAYFATFFEKIPVFDALFGLSPTLLTVSIIAPFLTFFPPGANFFVYL